MIIGCGWALASCADLTYYRQAAAGQWALLQARRPVTEWLADPATSPELRQRLTIARELRAFASVELALPDNGSYQTYADLQRPWVVKICLPPRNWRWSRAAGVSGLLAA